MLKYCVWVMCLVCGGGEGLVTYAWIVNLASTPPSGRLLRVMLP